MTLKVILENDLNKINRQIKALESIIPLDNKKDKQIHMHTLISLKVHRKMLEEKVKDKLNS